MTERIINGFFYGLFMDVGILRKSNVSPINPRRAYVDGFALRIGDRASLIPQSGSRAYGMLIGLTHAEFERLYTAAGLENYRPEPVLAQVIDGSAIPALCYNLLVEPPRGQRNVDYTSRLQKVLRELEFPTEYVESLMR
jgi:hypothetical protein